MKQLLSLRGFLDELFSTVTNLQGKLKKLKQFEVKSDIEIHLNQIYVGVTSLQKVLHNSTLWNKISLSAKEVLPQLRELRTDYPVHFFGIEIKIRKPWNFRSQPKLMFVDMSDEEFLLAK